MKDELTVGIFGFMQLALKDSGYRVVNGKLRIKRPSLNEENIQAVYNFFAEKTKGMDLKSNADRVNQRVNKLVNKDATVNNFYMALHLAVSWLEQYGDALERSLYMPKVMRLIDETKKYITPEVAKYSFRVADNLIRQYEGRAQLADEVRDAKFRKILGQRCETPGSLA